jgi:hypothetical protein
MTTTAIVNKVVEHNKLERFAENKHFQPGQVKHLPSRVHHLSYSPL